MLKIASWNVNSITIRKEQVIDVMKMYDLDALVIQETKTIDAGFPIETFVRAGYNVLFSGQKSFNGVCIISKQKLTNSTTKLPNMLLDYQRRFIQADLDSSIGKVTLVNCYVPNGKEVGDEKYFYKIKWLKSLIEHLKELKKITDKIILMGDFNIATDDRDVYDVDGCKDKILCSDEERNLLEQIKELGFTDSFRMFNNEEKQFSWWDYRENGFYRNIGFRIDYIFISEALKQLCKSSVIEKKPRMWERPSDHTPVIASFE